MINNKYSKKTVSGNCNTVYQTHFDRRHQGLESSDRYLQSHGDRVSKIEKETGND
jgi:hypothetical protein